MQLYDILNNRIILLFNKSSVDKLIELFLDHFQQLIIFKFFSKIFSQVLQLSTISFRSKHVQIFFIGNYFNISRPYTYYFGKVLGKRIEFDIIDNNLNGKLN